MPKVTWGGEWGCPNVPTKWSGTYIYVVDEQCEFCDEEGIGCQRGTVTDAERCSQQKYNIFDLNTNSILSFCYFHGDCASCTALTVGHLLGELQYVDNLKWTGVAFCSAGTLMYFGLLLWTARRPYSICTAPPVPLPSPPGESRNERLVNHGRGWCLRIMSTVPKNAMALLSFVRIG
jgi:hypothetical protein